MLHCRVRLVLGKTVDVEVVVGVAARTRLAGFFLLAADFHHELDGSVEAAVEVSICYSSYLVYSKHLSGYIFYPLPI